MRHTSKCRVDWPLVVNTAPIFSPASTCPPFATVAVMRLLYTVRKAPCERMTVQPAPGISNVLETVPPKTERTELPASVEMSMPLLSMVIPGRLGCGWRPNFPVSTPRRTGQGRADRLRSKAAETIFPSGVSANSPAELSRSTLSSASMILRMVEQMKQRIGGC